MSAAQKLSSFLYESELSKKKKIQNYYSKGSKPCYIYIYHICHWRLRKNLQQFPLQYLTWE